MKIYISPMAGVTDYSYRKIMEKFNPDLMFCEMVNAHLMTLNSESTLKLLKCDNYENTGAQVFGFDRSEIIFTFLKLEKLGFKRLNLNMGCPQPKIIKTGAGSALLPNVEFIDSLLCELKEKLQPYTKLSIKIRIGYKNFNNPDIYVNMANKYNLDFICVHGRTQEQMYSGEANWNIVRNLSSIKRNIDFIGNGDLIEAEKIISTIKGSSLDGIMLSRGIVGNPWLISQAREIVTTGKISTIPSFNDVKSILLEHLNLLIENKGEVIASMEINKFIIPYFKNFFDNYKNLKSILNSIIIEKNLSEKILKIKNL